MIYSWRICISIINNYQEFESSRYYNYIKLFFNLSISCKI